MISTSNTGPKQHMLAWETLYSTDTAALKHKEHHQQLLLPQPCCGNSTLCTILTLFIHISSAGSLEMATRQPIHTSCLLAKAESECSDNTSLSQTKAAHALCTLQHPSHQLNTPHSTTHTRTQSYPSVPRT